MNRLGPVRIALGISTALASVTAVVLDKSLPYRIGLIDYTKYTWVGRFAGIALGLAVLIVLCGIVGRKSWSSVGLAVLGLSPLLLMGVVHSGPNPEAWCFNNLRQIEGAKEQLVREHGLTDRSPVTLGDISPLIPRGPELRCAEHGTYIINAIGVDARCTVHGSILEMEAKWKTIQAQQRAAVDGGRAPQSKLKALGPPPLS